MLSDDTRSGVRTLAADSIPRSIGDYTRKRACPSLPRDSILAGSHPVRCRSRRRAMDRQGRWLDLFRPRAILCRSAASKPRSLGFGASTGASRQGRRFPVLRPAARPDSRSGGANHHPDRKAEGSRAPSSLRVLLGEASMIGIRSVDHRRASKAQAGSTIDGISSGEADRCGSEKRRSLYPPSLSHSFFAFNPRDRCAKRLDANPMPLWTLDASLSLRGSRLFRFKPWPAAPRTPATSERIPPRPAPRFPRPADTIRADR